MILSPSAWSALVGFFMPFVVEFIKTKIKSISSLYSYLLALFVSVLIGSVTIYLDGQFDVENILQSASIALASSQTVYHLWFRGSNLKTRINKL